MSVVRDKLNAIGKARDLVEVFSTDEFIRRHGQHPGGPVAEARERFYETIVGEFERMNDEIAMLRRALEQERQMRETA